MNKIAIDHFTQYRFVQKLRAKKDKISFAVLRADLEENTYKSDIWILPDGEEPRPLTQGGEEGAYWWLDDTDIVFSAKRSKKDKETAQKGLPLTVLYRVSTERAGEAKEWLRLRYNITDIAFLSEDKFLFTASFSPLYENIKSSADGDEKTAELLAAEQDYEVLEELPFWHNGAGFSKRARNRLYLYDGGKIKSITGEKTDVCTLSLSPQKEAAYCITRTFDKVAPLTTTITRIDLHTMRTKKLRLPAKFVAHELGVVDESAIVLAGSDMKHGGINENPHFYMYDVNTDSMEVLYSGREYSLGDSVGTDLRMAVGEEWAVQDGLLYWISTVDYSSQIMTLDLKTGEISQLTKKDGAISEFVLHGGEVVFSGFRKLDGVELYSLRGDKEKKLTSFNAALSDAYEQYLPEKLTFQNSEGRKINGWVIKPRGYRDNKKFPAILDIHGGPKTVYGPIVYHEMQYWAACGYGVFFCNPTGGDGGGEAFSDIRGKYGAIDYEDLMAFTEEVLRKNPWIDAKRVGVTGGSYGGFMTNWIIGHTDRFRAAASQRSISNWISMTLTTDIGYFFGPDQTAGDVWGNHEKMWDQSPLKYADRVKTPTLFIHSEEDYRCWMTEALQIYSALQIHGVDTRLCLFRGENHELSRSGKPKHRIRRLKEITDWFDKYLR